MSMDTPPPPPPPPPPPVSGPGPGPGPSSGPPAGNPLVGYWKRVVLENYANFNGRASRPEFWWYTLANFLVVMIAYVVAIVLAQAATALGVIVWLAIVVYGIAVIVPGIAVAVRRLHDTDKSGFFLFLYFIPCVGPIIVIVFLATDTTPGPNQYGIAPG
jgi:uncharacterized membrane protein YhaH (DUF805 family)